MRTKTLLLTAAVGLAGIASSMAQVYSVNAVGYINVTVQRGFNLVGNGLMQTNYALTALIPESSIPDQTQVYTFTEGPGGGFSLFTNEGGTYDPDPTGTTIPFGKGVFINNRSAGPFTLTSVGEVAQGVLDNPVPAGFSIRISKVPQAGLLQTTLLFTPSLNDIVYLYANNGTTAGYEQYQSLGPTPGDWDPMGPTLGVGQAMFVNSVGHTWTRTFTVN
jgi:hypothetical protein